MEGKGLQVGEHSPARSKARTRRPRRGPRERTPRPGRPRAAAHARRAFSRAGPSWGPVFPHCLGGRGGAGGAQARPLAGRRVSRSRRPPPCRPDPVCLRPGRLAPRPRLRTGGAARRILRAAAAAGAVAVAGRKMMKFRFRRQGADPQREKLKQELFAFNKVRRRRPELGGRGRAGGLGWGPGASVGGPGTRATSGRGGGKGASGARGAGPAAPSVGPTPRRLAPSALGLRVGPRPPPTSRVGLSGPWASPALSLQDSVYLGVCVSLSLRDSACPWRLPLPVFDWLPLSLCLCVCAGGCLSLGPVYLSANLFSVSTSLRICVPFLRVCRPSCICVISQTLTLSLEISPCGAPPCPSSTLGAAQGPSLF